MNREEANDEINLAELLLRLWKYKFLFVVVILIFVCCSVVYISKTPKIYTSTSIFIPENKSSSNTFLNGALAQLSSIKQLTGISPVASNSEALIERFTGRDFILQLAHELKLYDDQFFNRDAPKIQEPFWKTKLKSLINWQSRSLNPAQIAEWNVLENFKKNVTITDTSGGAIKISSDHFDPERAAEIANHTTTKIISVLKTEKLESVNAHLDYLSQRLADSLIAFENAEENLKQFMLSDNTVAKESFYKGSIILDKLRTQLEDSKKQIDTIDVLLSYTGRASHTFQDYSALRKKYPLLDQSDFRRILGISEIISAWSWPSVETLMRIRNSIQDRISSLETEIRKYEKEAIKYATSAEQLNKLKREMQIAEATYKVLVEHAKIQSLAAGFTEDTSQIIAAADAAIVETEPKKRLILAIAATAGFLVSAILSLILSSNKGVLYSSGELLRTISPKFHHKIRSLNYYRTSNLHELQDRLVRRPAPWLKQLFLETSANRRTTSIIVADTTNLHAATVIARLLAVRAHEFDMSVAYVDLSKTLQLLDIKQDDQVGETKTEIEVAEFITGCTEYNYRSGRQNVEWLFSKSFQKTIDFLNTKHDTIIFSANSDILDLLLASGKLHEEKLVIHASKGKTTYENIRKLNALGNIEIALLS